MLQDKVHVTDSKGRLLFGKNLTLYPHQLSIVYIVSLVFYKQLPVLKKNTTNLDTPSTELWRQRPRCCCHSGSCLCQITCSKRKKFILQKLFKKLRREKFVLCKISLYNSAKLHHHTSSTPLSLPIVPAEHSSQA